MCLSHIQQFMRRILGAWAILIRVTSQALSSACFRELPTLRKTSMNAHDNTFRCRDRDVTRLCSLRDGHHCRFSGVDRRNLARHDPPHVPFTVRRRYNQRLGLPACANAARLRTVGSGHTLRRPVPSATALTCQSRCDGGDISCKPRTFSEACEANHTRAAAYAR